MNIEELAKDFNKSNFEFNKETEALKAMSDVDLCEKMISFLEEDLDDLQKETSYGDDLELYTYWEIEKAFDSDVFSIESAFIYFRALFYYEILSFCGCGNPQMILNGVILPLLEAFNDGAYENFNMGYGKNTGMSEALVEFFLHYLDKLGLTNHGSSVWGSWLESKGRLWREILRRSEEIEV